MRTKKIYTRKVAYELRKMGLKILKTEPNEFKPEFNVYIFEDTPELQAALGEYMKNKK